MWLAKVDFKLSPNDVKERLSLFVFAALLGDVEGNYEKQSFISLFGRCLVRWETEFLSWLLK